MHIEKLNFTGDKISAVEAMVQLAQDAKLKSKVTSLSGKGILLWQKGQRAIRLYPSISVCVKPATVTDDEGDDDSQWIHNDDVLTDIANGKSTAQQWVERFGEPDEIENGIYASYDKPYFQLANASGNPIGDKLTYLPMDYLDVLVGEQNTVNEAFKAFAKALPCRHDSKRAITKTDYYDDGSHIVWFYPDEKMPVPSKATYYPPEEADIMGRRFIDLSQAQMDAIMSGKSS